MRAEGFLAGIIVEGYGLEPLVILSSASLELFLADGYCQRLGHFPGGDIAGQIISATVGAVVLLVLISFVRRVA